MYSKAEKLGGQIQLHQAKKMSATVYKEVIKHGISADYKSACVVRFEQVSYAIARGLNMVLRDPLSAASGWTISKANLGSLRPMI